MFETAEIGSKVEKSAYQREAPKVRAALLDVQKELARSNQALVVLIGGVEGGGKSETVNLLLEWMDARGIAVHALWNASDEERERPEYWRYWRTLPPTGRAAIYIGSWYTAPIIEHAFGRSSDLEFDESMDRIVEFERMLSKENVLVVKFWMHLTEKDQYKRLKKLYKDPNERWRVTKLDWKFHKNYETFREVSGEALRKTSTGHAAWHIVEATDKRHRNLTVARTLVQSIRDRLDAIRKAPPKPKGPPALPVPKKQNLISALDLSLEVSDKEYEEKVEKLQGRLGALSRRLHDARRSAILVFEGADAAGKGGTIRTLTRSMDARNWQVMPVAAPTEEERSHPYLWRFWRQIPRAGRVTIYDRSWYGRVLVERIEGFCSVDAWKRAYNEINEFEEQLVQGGTVLLKFWLQISPEEQLKRFKSREVTPYKQYKITEEDWRNRKKFDAYTAAACDMVEQTSTGHAPWTLVEANDKQYARLKVLKTVVKRLEKELD